MSARLAVSLSRFAVMAVLWIVVQKLLDLVGWSQRETWPELLFTSAIFGGVWGGWEYYRYPRRSAASGALSTGEAPAGR